MYYSASHPDAITDWQHAKEIRRGCHQAMEDKAIAAYHNALHEGKSKQEAEKQYFESFKWAYGKETLLPTI